MNIESVVTAQTGGFGKTALSRGAEDIKQNRLETSGNKISQADQAEAQKAPPEELLTNIKALTEEGLYSVRFEMHKDTNDMVINLIEQETGEVIRQIPPDEILGMRETLASLRGNLVETES